MITLILEIILLLFAKMTFGSIIWISFIVTTVSYLIGDLLILPATNNSVATLSDIGLSFVVIYLFNFFWQIGEISLANAIVSAVVIGVGEWFLHRYMLENVIDHLE
jgi:uncharacterized membrane protein YvlD (DUF360 family)